jgi:hypothetical protein
MQINTNNKNVIIFVSSAICLNMRDTFIYGNTEVCRTKLNYHRRFNQTKNTIKNLKFFFPSADIILLDCGAPKKEIREYFNNIEQTEIVFLKDIDRVSYDLNCQSTQKGFCEANLVITFLDYFKNKIQSADYVFKISGRYFINSVKENIILNSNNTIFTKTTCNWPFEKFSDLNIYPPYLNINNKLHYTLTGFYGASTDILSLFRTNMFNIRKCYEKNNCTVDFEVLFHYYMIHKLKNNIKHKVLDIFIEGLTSAEGEHTIY